MEIAFTLDKEFDSIYESYAASRDGLNLLKLDGIDHDKLDAGKMSHKYFTERLADMTIDANSNSNAEISHNSYVSELYKAQGKLEGYYLLWRYGKRMFGAERAEELIRAILDGDVYFHDSSNIQIPYCMAISTQLLMTEGRQYGQLKSKPPKRADSFIAQATELVIEMSTNWCGAIAPADLLVNYCYYAKKEGLDDYRILNDLQRFVHIVNLAFRPGAQSPSICKAA